VFRHLASVHGSPAEECLEVVFRCDRDPAADIYSPSSACRAREQLEQAVMIPLNTERAVDISA
jgi:hypothetical protein